MIKRIINAWRLNLSELYVTLFFMLVFDIIGMIIVAVVLKFDTESAYATQGTLFAVIVGIFANVIMGVIAFPYNFNMNVSLGCTRKEFLIVEGITAYLNIIVETLAVMVLYFVETALGKVLYAGKECENLIAVLMKLRIVPVVILMLPAMMMFGGAVILKFKKYAYWVLWGMWMLFFTGCGKLADYIEENPGSIVAKVCYEIADFVTGMSDVALIAVLFVIACIFMTGTVLLVRKQPVEA